MDTCSRSNEENSNPNTSVEGTGNSIHHIQSDDAFLFSDELGESIENISPASCNFSRKLKKEQEKHDDNSGKSNTTQRKITSPRCVSPSNAKEQAEDMPQYLTTKTIEFAAASPNRKPMAIAPTMHQQYRKATTKMMELKNSKMDYQFSKAKTHTNQPMSSIAMNNNFGELESSIDDQSTSNKLNHTSEIFESERSKKTLEKFFKKSDQNSVFVNSLNNSINQMPQSKKTDCIEITVANIMNHYEELIDAQINEENAAIKILAQGTECTNQMSSNGKKCERLQNILNATKHFSENNDDIVSSQKLTKAHDDENRQTMKFLDNGEEERNSSSASLHARNEVLDNEVLSQNKVVKNIDILQKYSELFIDKKEKMMENLIDSESQQRPSVTFPVVSKSYDKQPQNISKGSSKIHMRNKLEEALTNKGDLAIKILNYDGQEKRTLMHSPTSVISTSCNEALHKEVLTITSSKDREMVFKTTSMTTDIALKSQAEQVSEAQELQSSWCLLENMATTIVEQRNIFENVAVVLPNDLRKYHNGCDDDSTMSSRESEFYVRSINYPEAKKNYAETNSSFDGDDDDEDAGRIQYNANDNFPSVLNQSYLSLCTDDDDGLPDRYDYNSTTEDSQADNNKVLKNDEHHYNPYQTPPRHLEVNNSSWEGDSTSSYSTSSSSYCCSNSSNDWKWHEDGGNGTVDASNPVEDDDLKYQDEARFACW